MISGFMLLAASSARPSVVSAPVGGCGLLALLVAGGCGLRAAGSE